jgi:hypothetical protein
MNSLFIILLVVMVVFLVLLPFLFYQMGKKQGKKLSDLQYASAVEEHQSHVQKIKDFQTVIDYYDGGIQRKIKECREVAMTLFHAEPTLLIKEATILHVLESTDRFLSELAPFQRNQTAPVEQERSANIYRAIIKCILLPNDNNVLSFKQGKAS